MNHIPRSSESKASYLCMCREVGTPTEVRIRREVTDTAEVLYRPVWIMRGFDRMISGSRREGFRLIKSDHDHMFWLPDHKVICDLSQISLYSTPQHSLILMEYEDLPPGFTRLKMLAPSSEQRVNLSCVAFNGGIYVSSLLFKAHFLDGLQRFSAVFKCSTLHGPCATYTHRGLETDRAYCFRSHHWPNVALPWIQRCQRKQWPPDGVLSTILKEGYHIVPISSDPLNPEKGTEWRISFSGAEQKLVYSMNHCQFLCYGMLKILLTEVINAGNNDPCLCSYFMKTVIFWIIQDHRHIEWTPCNLLTCFWTCFKLLLSWVYKGECPNFFIPQNNMFRVKVVGQRQVALFDQLYVLYCEGIPCLLSNPTIRKFLNMTTDEYSIISDVKLDVCLFKELDLTCNPFVKNIEGFVRSVFGVEHFLKSRLTSFQTVTVQHYLSGLLKHFSCLMLSQTWAILSNKKRTNLIRKSLNIMKVAVKVGCASDILYLAMYYYKIRQYEQSLRFLQRAQERMSKPFVIYMHHINEKVYRRATQRMSLSEKMRKCFISMIISLHGENIYIDELVPEQEANRADGCSILTIPPFVMLHMLFVLNYHKLGDTVRSQQSLQDLHILLLYDDGTYVPKADRDISWQILGICQNTCGDYVGALTSFQCSLQQVPVHCIQKVTMLRIQNTRLLQR